MKLNLSCTLFLVVFLSFAQSTPHKQIGEISINELKTNIYAKDSSAIALVLDESARYFVDVSKKYTHITDYYYRIKILKSEALERATVKIPLFGDEKISLIKASSAFINQDGEIEKRYTTSENIIRNQVDETTKEAIINIPNARVGSVIEYTYRITSPYYYIRDWYFQSDIPKIKSEFSYSIPETREYLTRLRGIDTLSYKESHIGPCLTKRAIMPNCKFYTYKMDSIEAFKAEPFMPITENYISSLTFKLSYILSPKTKFPLYRTLSNWGEFDNSYRYDLENDNKVDAKFFKRKLPDSIKNMTDKLDQAKSIFHFIQDHFTWNQYLGGSTSYKLRKSFKQKNGSVNLINGSLYHSLNSVGIDCKYVLLSTRGHGIPENDIPIKSDFNYMIVKATIDGQDYFLDATEKNTAFGIVPIRTLNARTRVMDFKKGSYWQKISLAQASTKNSAVRLNFDDEMNIQGEIVTKKSGILAYTSRKTYREIGKNEYEESISSNMRNLNIEEFSVENLEDREESFIEKQLIYLETDDVNESIDSEDVIKFSPVFFGQLKINPFKSNERKFELDFIHPRKNIYRFSLKIPEGYSVKKLPKNLGLKLPNNGGSYIYRIFQKNDTVNLYIKFFIKKDLFSQEEYFYLKKLYEQIIKTEDQFIEIVKTK